MYEGSQIKTCKLSGVKVLSNSLVSYKFVGAVYRSLHWTNSQLQSLTLLQVQSHNIDHAIENRIYIDYFFWKDITHTTHTRLQFQKKKDSIFNLGMRRTVVFSEAKSSFKQLPRKSGDEKRERDDIQGISILNISFQRF